MTWGLLVPSFETGLWAKEREDSGKASLARFFSMFSSFDQDMQGQPLYLTHKVDTTALVKGGRHSFGARRDPWRGAVLPRPRYYLQLVRRNKILKYLAHNNHSIW